MGGGAKRSMAVAGGGSSGFGGIALTYVLIAAAALRLALFFAPGIDFLPRILEQRPELGTPISSFMAIKEALYLQSLHISSAGTLPKPYASGTLHVPPILLAILEPTLALLDRAYLAIGSFDRLQSLHRSTSLVWTAADLLSATFLANIFTQKQKYMKRIHHSADQAQLDTAILAGSLFASPGGVAAAYLFNPFTIATCLARSASTWNNVALLAAVNAALAASPLFLSITIASAVLISLYPVLLIPAAILLCATNATGTKASTARRRHGKQIADFSTSTAIVATLLTLLALVAGVYASYVIAGYDWNFVRHSYGTILLLTDLTPNIGLWWYFFIEIFDHFRDFFLLTFNVHAASYALPFTIKYAVDPLFAITALSGFTAMLKSYPTLGDASLFFALLSLHREIAPYLRYTLLTTLLYALATLMMPALHHLWLVAGSGNANFFYATTLIWAFASGLAALDAMWAWGRWRWEVDRPKLHVRQAYTDANSLTDGKNRPLMVRTVVQS